MISTELLRRYPVFGSLDDEQLKKVSMITEEDVVEKGTTIFNKGEPANTLYILVEGAVDLFYPSEKEYPLKNIKEFSVGEINPGEVFSISALIEPYILGATARSAQDCRILKIDAVKLRNLCRQDQYLANKSMKKITSALMERLMYARIQLAASQN